jgi:hypothetical protein
MALHSKIDWTVEMYRVLPWTIEIVLVAKARP